jgi:hypothetical protein
MKKYIYKSFGETIEKAESMGFIDTENNWSPEIADGLELDALEFITGKGYTIIFEGEENEDV